MSDRVAKSEPDNGGTARQSMNHYQFAWMDHWKHTSRKPSAKVHNHLLHCQGQNNDDYSDSKQHPLLSGPEMETNILKCSQGFGEVSEARTINTMKSLNTGSMNLGKEILDGQPLPMFSNTGNSESAMSSKNNEHTSSNGAPLKYQIDLNDDLNSITMGRSEWAYPEMKCLSGECKFQPEGISRVPDQLVKSHEFLEGNKLAVSASFKDDDGSSSKIVPYVANNGVAPMQSFTCQQEITDQSRPVVASKEHFMDDKLCSYSTFWVHEKRADAVVESRKQGRSLSGQNDAPLLRNDQSTKDGQLPSFYNKQNQVVENNASVRLLPSLGCPEAMKSEKAYDEHFLLPSIPRSVHDVKTMRISTTIGSLEELPRGPFSQTTHQFFITKKTGVNLTEEGQVLRDAMVSTKLKGNMVNEFLSLSPSFCFPGQQGVKLQPLESSTDSEGKYDVGDVRTSTACLKNESSVETDTMELDDFQKSHLSGVALCPSDQNIKGVRNSLLSGAEKGTGEEAGNKMANIELSDMKEGLPALPARANSVDDGGTSTSRTQSLDAEHLLCQAEQPSDSNTSVCPDGPSGPEPSSRWVKRLKLSTSDPFAYGTKSSRLGEVSFREKDNKMFSKTSSEPSARPQLALDQTAKLLKNADYTSSDSVRKNQEVFLSRSWIQRWCRQRAASPNKKPNAVVLCEPQTQSSKTTSDELEKKQFPSAAAMALMGKAMSGFHPCEFRRKGPLIIWSA